MKFKPFIPSPKGNGFFGCLIIKPHYLYNTLDVIRMMALENDDREVAKMVESLSSQLKYLIGCHSDRVPLYRELDNIREYFTIMKARYENRICLEMEVEEDTLNCGILKLSLQPIVENAVKHGLRPKESGGTVRIQAQRLENRLELTVMDDGIGMSEKTLCALQNSLQQKEMGVREKDGWHHVGLKNAYDRIQKNFGKDYGIEIISTDGIGTIVNLSFPIMEAKDSIF